MYRLSLIPLTTMMMAALVAGNVNAQDITPKKYSVGPALEFSGGGTSFGIQGKINVIPNFSVRPIVLFGYQPGVSFSATYQNDVSNFLPGAAQIVIETTPGPKVTERIVPSGTAYGLAVTYDFAFSNSKLSGYVGPRILFVSASGSGVSTVKVNTDETNIGLIAGVDYAISDKLSAGLNATYDLSRSGSSTVKGYSDNRNNGTFPLSGGGGFNIGVNVGYSF